MTKRIERVFRDRHLTPEEAARDAEIRRKVQIEFPPRRTMGMNRGLAQKNESSLSGLLKQTIRDSGKSVEEVARGAGLPVELLVRFLSGERDIHMATADKLADTLGLRLAAN